MLNRAVGNLLSNALRHGPRDCTVTVKAVAHANGSADIEVANPGAGIAREHLPRIFDRFYRPCSAREGSSAGFGARSRHREVDRRAARRQGRGAQRAGPGDRLYLELSGREPGVGYSRTSFRIR